MFDNDLKLQPFLLSISCHVKNLDFFIRSRVTLDVLQSASNVKITSRITRHTILAAVSPLLTFASKANCIIEFFGGRLVDHASSLTPQAFPATME